MNPGQDLNYYAFSPQARFEPGFSSESLLEFETGALNR